MTGTLNRADEQSPEQVPQEQPRSEIERTMLRERERLTTQRAGVWKEIKALEDRTKGINIEIERIDAYLKFQPGKTQGPSEPSDREIKDDKKTRKPSGPRAPRGSGTGLRQEVLDLIRRSQSGMMPNDVIAEMNADEKKANAIRQAIFALKKQGSITQAGNRQPYTATEHPAAEGFTQLTLR